MLVEWMQSLTMDMQHFSELAASLRGSEPATVAKRPSVAKQEPPSRLGLPLDAVPRAGSPHREPAAPQLTPDQEAEQLEQRASRVQTAAVPLLLSDARGHACTLGTWARHS